MYMYVVCAMVCTSNQNAMLPKWLFNISTSKSEILFNIQHLNDCIVMSMCIVMSICVLVVWLVVL